MSIRNLRIEGFRGFRRLRVDGLGRVNRIVGPPGSGKTAVLEAIGLLAAGGDASAIWSILYRRGETSWVEDEGRRRPGSIRFDVERLFHGDAANGASFRIAADTDRGEAAMTARIERFRPAEGRAPTAAAPLLLRVAWSPGPPGESVFPIEPRGGIATSTITRTARRGGGEGSPVRFVGTPIPNMDQLIALFERIDDGPGRDRVADWLRVVEPRIEEIAPGLPGSAGPSSRGGLLVRLRGADEQMPIETLGAGASRMFALAVSLAHASGGLLLADEIDAGICRDAIEALWDLVADSAERFDVQVFATATRPDGCEGRGDVATRRIDPAREEAVTLDGGIGTDARRD